MKVKLANFLRWSTESKETSSEPVQPEKAPTATAAKVVVVPPSSGNGRAFWLDDGEPASGKISVEVSRATGGCVVSAPSSLGVGGQAWLVLDSGENFPVVVSERTADGETDRLETTVAAALGADPESKPDRSARWSWIGDGGVLVTEWASLRNVASGKVERMSSRTPPFPSLVMIGGSKYSSVATTVETRIQDKQPITVVEILDTFEVGAKAA